MYRPGLTTIALILHAVPCPSQTTATPLFLPTAGSTWYPSGSNVGPVKVIDANGDGLPDLALGMIYVRSSPPLPNIVFSYWINDGNGAIARHDVIEPPPPQQRIFHRVLAVGDVDGNGTEDVFVGRSVGPATPLDDVLYLNQGNASFVLAQGHLPSTQHFTADAAFLDADGDGDLDLFLMDVYGPNRLYINDGTGRFTDESATRLPTPTGANGTKTLVFDVDRDGDTDVFVGNMGINLSPQMPTLYVNDGTGRFQYGQVFTQPGWTIHGCLGDLDNDGWTDVLLLDNVPPTILHNQQGVLVAAGATFPASLDMHSWIGLVDFDGDGDLDLVSPGTSTHTLLEHTGGFRFIDATARMPPGPSHGGSWPTLFDLDLDGDLDLLAWGKLYRSTRREVAPRNDPTRGTVWSVGLFGQPGHMLLLAIALGSGSTPFPGLGWLWLDPTSAQFLGALYFGAHQEQTLSMFVPAIPALAGLQLCVQALDLDLSDLSAQFTNSPCSSVR